MATIQYLQCMDVNDVELTVHAEVIPPQEQSVEELENEYMDNLDTPITANECLTWNHASECETSIVIPSEGQLTFDFGSAGRVSINTSEDKSNATRDQPTEEFTIVSSMPDPFFSGIDTQVWLKDGDEELRLGCVQTVSLDYDLSENKYTGRLVVLLTGEKSMRQICEEIDGRELMVIQVNDYGQRGVFMEPRIVRVMGASSGIALDDIVVEASVYFHTD